MPSTPWKKHKHADAQDPQFAFAEKLRALDQDAWASLFDDHREQLWRYTLARTGNPDTADDITAQVFVEALDSIHRYQYRGKPVIAWLCTIARNHVGKLLRQAKHTVQTPSQDAATHDTADATLDSLVLASALRSLTSEQADVIALRYFAGHSTREIALALGKSEPAIYSLQVRAINSLRRHLQGAPEIMFADPTKFGRLRV